MITRAVAISGTVGKQVHATTQDPVILKGLHLSPLSANAYVKIRDGNASGNILIEWSNTANLSNPIEFPEEGMKFLKGMHVKVLGTGAVCYLWES